MRAQLQYFDGRKHRVMPLGEEPLVIGGRASPIQVPGATRTRRHARVYAQEGGFWIEDLGGDGVWLNGDRTERSALSNRDRIRVGSLELEYFAE